MNRDREFSAYDVVNSYSMEDLWRIIRDYGEEKFAKRVAEFIVNKREEKPIETTLELVDIIKAAIPAKVEEKVLIRLKEPFKLLE